VLRQASQPLGPMGSEWLKRQERAPWRAARRQRDMEIRGLLELSERLLAVARPRLEDG